jgi:hypothetical protein
MAAQWRPPDKQEGRLGRAALSDSVSSDDTNNNTSRLRLQRQAVALHRLGPRPLAEFIDEIIARHPELQARLDIYVRLTPERLSAVGADRFPPAVFKVAS